MTRILVLTLVSGLLLSSQAAAQKVRKPTNTRETAVKADELPQISDFAYVISIDNVGNSTFKIQGDEAVDILSVGQVGDYFKKFHSLQSPAKPSSSNRNLNPVVVIRANPGTGMEQVLNVILAARVSYNSRVKVDVGESTFLFVPRKMDARQQANIRPNPLMLVVAMNEDQGLTLNNESYGDLADTFSLRKKVGEIFKARVENGVIREGTNDVEMTVFVKLPLSAGFGDLIKISRVLRIAGADRIGLQVDDLPDMVIDVRKKLIKIP